MKVIRRGIISCGQVTEVKSGPMLIGQWTRNIITGGNIYDDIGNSRWSDLHLC